MAVSSQSDILLPRNPTTALQAVPKQYVDTPRVVALTDAATIVVDATLGNIFDVTLGGNRILGNPTGAVNGQKFLFRIKQDATGGRTLAFGAKYRFGPDLPSVVLSTAAGKLDRIGVEYVAADDKFDIIALGMEDAEVGVNSLTGMVHATAYGVVADGTTDNTTALTNALTVAEAAGGVAVLLPKGRIRYTAGLTLKNAHLVGQAGMTASRTTPAADYGTVLAPAITAADQAAITIPKGDQGSTIRGVTLDLKDMANGTTNAPFTRAQTKGIHIDGAMHTHLEDIYIKYTPTNAAAIFVDEGAATPLGSFWVYMRSVFVAEWTKKGIANGWTTQLGPGNVPEAAKDISARGIVLAGAAIGVTAVTMLDVTTYRGLYMKNVQQLQGFNFHSENAPEHCVYIDGGDRATFTGGFFEFPGNEKASGDATVYRPMKGVNTPRLVSVRGCSWSGDGLNYAEWGKGLVVDLGDPTGNPAGDELKRYGSLTIDRAGAGLFTGNAELRVLGPFSGGAEISTTADSLVYGYKDVANVGTWDDLALYSNASANFNTPSDSVAGVFCKVYVHYNLYVRSTGVAFVDGDWLDVKFIPAGNLTYRNGTAAALVNRHLMAPGATTAQISGSFEVLITSGFNAYFNLMWRSSRANVVPGLDATDTGRGSISFRQVA